MSVSESVAFSRVELQWRGCYALSANARTTPSAASVACIAVTACIAVLFLFGDCADWRGV